MVWFWFAIYHKFLTENYWQYWQLPYAVFLSRFYPFLFFIFLVTAGAI